MTMAEIDGIKWVNDASHPKHPLKQIYKNTHFRCDLCRAHGRGLRLRWDRCNYTLHEGCSGLPAALPAGFFAHRHHPLHLRTTKPGLLSSPDCLLCGRSIHGAAFKCKDCDGVFLHPLCSRLPERVPAHSLHPIHPLTLVEHPATADCDACGKRCRKWRYHCGACGVHIHIECLEKGVDVLTERKAAKAQAKEKSKGYIFDFVSEVIIF